jgi:hypothetical protein
MYRKLLFLTIVIVGIFFAIAVFAQTCPHIYEGINCGANWYCNGCQTTCKTCPGGGDPTGATELNYVSCSCSCPSGQIVCSNACVTAPACGTPTREQNNSSCNGCGVCKSGYAADPANPNPPSPCLKAAYIDYPNTGYFQTSGDLKSTGGDLYLASGKAVRIDGAGTTTLSFKNFTGTSLDLTLFGGLIVGAPTGGSKGPGTINAEQLCVQGSCRTTWPEAVSAFVDEGNVGFGPTAVLGTNDNTPLSFEINNVGRMYIDTAGNVGIGTASPGVPLEVAGSILSSGASNLVKVGNSSLDLSTAIYVNAGGNIIQAANYTQTAIRNLLLNPSGGNVGIGTINPGAPLDVIGNIRSSRTAATASDVTLSAQSGIGYIGSMVNNVPLGFIINNAEKARIDTTGNVGIGTTNTTYKLMVAGAAPRIYLMPTGGTNSELDFGSPAMDTHWSIYRDTGTDQLRFWRTDNQMVITSGGNVGIGTTSPAYKLDVAGTIQATSSTIDTAVIGNNNSAKGSGVAGYANGTTDANAGGDFESFGPGGYGVVGTADGAGGYGVWGYAFLNSSINYGVYGKTNSPAGWGGYFTGGKGVFTPQLCLGTEGNCRTDWPGATPPGGSDKQVQFNDGGVFGGSGGLIYDKAVSYLSVGGPLSVGGTIGVNGLGTSPSIGIQSRGSSAGGYFVSSVASGYAWIGQGDYGVYAYGNSFGLYGLGGTYGVYGSGTSYGVYGNSNNTGVYGYGSVRGVYGETSFAAADAGYFYNTVSGTYARLGYSTWGGYFGGNVNMTGNLTVGSGSPSDDDYIYFDDGTKYLKWEEAMGRFYMGNGNGLFVEGQLTGTMGINTLAGGQIAAYDWSNLKVIRIRHDGTNGIVEPSSITADPGDLVLQSTYGSRYVKVEDDLGVSGGAMVGGVANKGVGTLNAAQLCINGVCQSSWPSGGTPGGANTYVQFNNSGAFGGSAGLTYNSGTSALTVGGLLTTGSLAIDSLSGVLKATGGAVSGGATTSDLTEGVNLYYTDARARASNSGTAPITYNAGTGAIGLSTPLAISYGGTGGTDTPTAGGVPYGTGAKYSFTAAGTSGQFLQSNGAGAPSWATIPASVGGSGTANYLAKFTAGTTLGNSLILDNGTNVQIVSGNLGIGWSPIYKLDVNGTAYLGGATTVAGALTVSGADLVADSNVRGTCLAVAVAAGVDTYCTLDRFVAGVRTDATGKVTQIICCEL